MSTMLLRYCIVSRVSRPISIKSSFVTSFLQRDTATHRRATHTNPGTNKRGNELVWQRCVAVNDRTLCLTRGCSPRNGAIAPLPETYATLSVLARQNVPGMVFYVIKPYNRQNKELSCCIAQEPSTTVASSK